MHAKASDAYEHILDSAGALAFVNEYSESAASPALYNAFAERKPACPLAQRYHMPRDPHEQQVARSICGLYWPRLG